MLFAKIILPNPRLIIYRLMKIGNAYDYEIANSISPCKGTCIFSNLLYRVSINDCSIKLAQFKQKYLPLRLTMENELKSTHPLYYENMTWHHLYLIWIFQVTNMNGKITWINLNRPPQKTFLQNLVWSYFNISLWERVRWRRFKWERWDNVGSRTVSFYE